ncbi:hypothetical protein F5Y05DRAFT_288564 [Hypoxylon sp. FL0543]|nr:hypothetical protein F5Y05DRAFT_288564 [Hypoxylon sp. FL0543]
MLKQLTLRLAIPPFYSAIRLQWQLTGRLTNRLTFYRLMFSRRLDLPRSPIVTLLHQLAHSRFRYIPGVVIIGLSGHGACLGPVTSQIYLPAVSTYIQSGMKMQYREINPKIGVERKCIYAYTHTPAVGTYVLEVLLTVQQLAGLSRIPNEAGWLQIVQV